MNATPLRLLLVLALGLSVGLIYGWLIQPVTYVQTTPDSLRSDYRTDYVLMVAEAYAGPASLGEAQRRLASLGPQTPVDIVRQAQVYAQANHFSQQDLRNLATLLAAFQAAPASPAIGGPP
jgi:hypothetical protein